MKIYLVGGAVRDKLMGLYPKDEDYVVVGSCEKEMLENNFQKVGKFFPIFLHPETKAEYALARREKINLENPSQIDFEINHVTLTEDLARRDLTINSMAIDSEGNLVDPFLGNLDLKNKILRHTSEAFSDDPLRVLRVARFCAKWPDFTIAEETFILMKKIVQKEYFKNISSERIVLELTKVFQLEKPSLFFEVLRLCNGLYHFKELEALIDVPQNAKYHPEGDCWVHTMMVLDASVKTSNHSHELMFAALVHDLGKALTKKENLPSHIGHEESGLRAVNDLCHRIKVSNNWQDMALVVTQYHLKMHRIKEMTANSIVKLFIDIDAFRRPERLLGLIKVCEADDLGKLRDHYEEGEFALKCFEAVKNIKPLNMLEIPEENRKERIRQEKVKVLKKCIREWSENV